MNFARYPMHNEPDMPAVTSSSVQIPLSLQVLLLLKDQGIFFLYVLNEIRVCLSVALR